MSRWFSIAVIGIWSVALAGPAAAADRALFNYQGRVLVKGVPYNGTGRMKAAILATDSGGAAVTLWSNDGTGAAGSEPLGSFDVTATAGVFDVMIGDAAAGMAAIPAILFNRDDELKVRVWFNDGTHGFQQLAPDRRLTNPRRLGLPELREATRLYVNGSTGNDLNSGLAAAAAKKTIQAAVNMLPGRIFNEVIVDVADGTYRETVNVNNIHAMTPWKVHIVGDENTTPTDTVSPAVRLTGADSDVTHAAVRAFGFVFDDCYDIELKGFLVDYCGADGVRIDRGRVWLNKCKAANNPLTAHGYHLTEHSCANFESCWAENLWKGYDEDANCLMNLTSCGATDCTFYGALGSVNSGINLFGACTFSRNLFGLGLWQSSSLWIESGTHAFTDNTTGIHIQLQSVARNIAGATFAGNGIDLAVSSDSTAH